MCEEPHASAGAVARVAPRPLGEGEVEPIALEPVDRVVLTTLVDNLSDALLLDQGPAKRMGLLAMASMPQLPEPLFEEGKTVDGLQAEHGFSMLVTVERGDRRSHILFDTGLTPDGMVGNMRRLGIDPADVEVVVLSHGHFDHTTGLDGLVRTVGRPNLPSSSTLGCGLGGASTSPASIPSSCPPSASGRWRAPGWRSSSTRSRRCCSTARC
jgi:7,8-dihydropterin-6-yl-methyl-4-(beta-D-ribofuranosyl)aminobenzene 5'-phosphate synthase